MKQFFKMVLAVVVAQIFILLIGFFIIIGMVSSIGASTPVTVSDNSILKIELNGELPDRASKDPTDIWQSMLNNERLFGLNEMVVAIQKAQKDDRIKGIFLQVMNPAIGPAAAHELRDALRKFRESGKFIYSYGDVYTQGSYYIGSVANKICIHQEGGIDFKGLNAQVLFYKGALEKLNVEMQIIRHGKFKSAVEPFINQKMSPENREQMVQLTGSVWHAMLEDISDSRKIDISQLNLIADSLLAFYPQKAKGLGMVDEVFTRDAMHALLMKAVKVSKDADLHLIELKDYVTAPSLAKEKAGRDRIAIVYAQGEISMGKGGDQAIGSENISKAIRKAANDEHVKAIVLRVNSPGGDALASEIIYNEVMRAKAKKPVVASFGNYAASGGYYIACGASKILADRQTLTGSIGVFGMIPNFQKLMNQKLGVTVDGVSTNKNSDYMSVLRPMTSFEQVQILGSIERIYGTFIGHVATGRQMRVGAVDSIGQGRVWSGVDAKRLGLIDGFGTLQDALAEAAKLAKIKTYNIQELPEQKSLYETMMGSLSGMKARMVKTELGEYYDYVSPLLKLRERAGIQARMPFDIQMN